MKQLIQNDRVFSSILTPLIFIVILGVSHNANHVFAQDSVINFGETLSGSIDTPGEIDTYTFSANMGDMILVGMSRVSGDLWQRIRLYDPDGNLLRDESSPVHVEISQLLPDRYCIYLPVIMRGNAGPKAENIGSRGLNIQANVPGTYTLLISDGFDGTYTGSYNLFIQRLNEPAVATDILFSQTLSGSIDQPAEMDAFTFSANAGDNILVGMSRVSGDLWQEIRLYDTNGNLLSEVSNPVHAENIYRVTATSDYTLLVADGFDGTYTGSYNLYIQRLNNPSNATSISFGEILPGSIIQAAEMDTYIFSANENDNVLIGMTRTSGSLWQGIRLYDPNGSLLNEDSAPTQAEITQTLMTTGVYTILASDGFDGTLVGEYNINLQQLP